MEQPTARRLVFLDDAAGQFNKTPAAFRYWISQTDCPLRVAKIGGRLMVRQSDIDKLIEEAFA